jgi:hypothetical protein
MGGICEVRRWDGIRCHDICFCIPSFINFRHSKLDRAGYSQRQHGDRISIGKRAYVRQ